MTPFFNINHLIPIMFLDNSLILSDKVCNLPSILTSKYILRAIGKPTEAIKVCNSEFILKHIPSIFLINKKAMPKI